MKKRGISLIVLVITIIVIVILGTAVIVTFAKNNPIETAKIAVLKGDAKTFSEELALTFADEKLKDKEFDPEIINAASVEDMKKYIPSFSEKYYGKLCIEKGKLCYVGGNVTESEKTKLEEVGLIKGSYITNAQIDDIISKKTNIPEGATTTDITEYIEEVPAEQAGKLTIFQGDLYYRWEKTNMAERNAFYEKGITLLAGDVNGDGTLTQEDANLVVQINNGSLDYALYPNAWYVSDVDCNNMIERADITALTKVISGTTPLIDVINIDAQKPALVKFLGDFDTYSNTINGDVYCAVGYNNLVKFITNITKEDAKRFVIVESSVKYRPEALTEEERNWIAKYGDSCVMIGDANMNGYYDEEDIQIIKEAQKAPGNLTSLQKYIYNIEPKVSNMDITWYITMMIDAMKNCSNKVYIN